MSGRPPLLVLALAGAFLLLVASLVMGSLASPEFPPYALTPAAPHPHVVGDSLVGPATYTLDASRGDAWRRFDFARTAVVDSGTWDIAFRRNTVIVASGAAVRDLGAAAFEAVAEAPPSGYVAGGPPEGLGKWYAYSMLSHLLTSKRHVYALRTSDGRYAKFEILAYYCREVGAACYTFRYVLQGDGSRRFLKTSRPRAMIAGGGTARGP
ncbi:MAG: HmuY family protein [Gemmatimonadales bacterium]